MPVLSPACSITISSKVFCPFFILHEQDHEVGGIHLRSTTFNSIVLRWLSGVSVCVWDAWPFRAHTRLMELMWVLGQWLRLWLIKRAIWLIHFPAMAFYLRCLGSAFQGSFGHRANKPQGKNAFTELIVSCQVWTGVSSCRLWLPHLSS